MDGGKQGLPDPAFNIIHTQVCVDAFFRLDWRIGRHSLGRLDQQRPAVNFLVVQEIFYDR